MKKDLPKRHVGVIVDTDGISCSVQLAQEITEQCLTKLPYRHTSKASTFDTVLRCTYEAMKAFIITDPLARTRASGLDIGVHFSTTGELSY